MQKWTINFDVPMYGNTPDNTHCYQAALKMIFNYYWPEKDFTWKELENISAKVEGLWTWPIASMIWMKEHGMDLKSIEVFDYEKFIEYGGQYLIEEYGEEMGNSQIEHSDIAQEQKLTRELLEKIEIDKRIPTIHDITDLLSQGYLITCNVNGRALIGKPGYSGHAIVIKGFDDKNLLIHNPGLPPQENVTVSFEQFEKAWAYPHEKAKNILAIKL